MNSKRIRSRSLAVKLSGIAATTWLVRTILIFYSTPLPAAKQSLPQAHSRRLRLGPLVSQESSQSPPLLLLRIETPAQIVYDVRPIFKPFLCRFQFSP